MGDVLNTVWTFVATVVLTLCLMVFVGGGRRG